MHRAPLERRSAALSGGVRQRKKQEEVVMDAAERLSTSGARCIRTPTTEDRRRSGAPERPPAHKSGQDRRGPEMRDKVILACQECKERNYNTKKNKRLHPERVEYKKYCRRCREHTPHKETK
jgi:large subunit ribosomal protein L33